MFRKLPVFFLTGNVWGFLDSAAELSCKCSGGPAAEHRHINGLLSCAEEGLGVQGVQTGGWQGMKKCNDMHTGY